MCNDRYKVCLITYYGDNYGGCLQAYAIQTIIQSLGYTVHIPLIYSPFQKRHLKIHKLLNVLRNPIGYLKRHKYITQHVQNDKLRQKVFNIFKDEFLNIDKSFVLDRTSQNSCNFQIYVCGSDQIWNPYLYGVDPIWTLKFAPAGSKKIAYAPSLGISSIPNEFIIKFQENLKDYTYLSCREQDGANCLSKILNRTVDVVLDPTLLLTPEQWQAFARPVDLQSPYIFCYLFGDYAYIDIVKKKIKKHFGLDIICLPYNLRELKSDDIKLYDITPNQFVWLIAHAQFVITDSFHASVFSIKMNTPFISLKRTSDGDKKNMNSRLYTLLQTTGLNDRMVGENMVDNIGEIADRPIDFKNANNKLSIYMKRDISRLERALSYE